ncbi:MAG: NAD(P)-binding protein [Thermodesulfobacteriota bacterium]|nr:NAD(P)-binding protein [Thermodesulfobacteriota bacterium]
MADKSYDVVIVGAGNKGLIAAMYLTKYGGLSVGLFEERHELASGWCTEEPAGGFMGNPCSQFHYGFYHVPTYWDFPEFKDYGARYALTPVNVGTVFDDGTCFLQFSAFPEVDPTQERTAEMIGRYSKRDAETYLWLWRKNIEYWHPAFMEWVFNPARPVGEPDAMDRLVMNPDSGIDQHWLFMTPIQLFTSLFENLHNQVAFFRVIQSWGIAQDEPGTGFLALLMIFQTYPFQCYALGGSHSLAHAAYRVIYENGGEVITNKKVDEVIVENGKARGIKLADGTAVEAKAAVLTNVGPHQLVFDLLGPGKVDAAIGRKVKHLIRDWIAIAWYSWSWTERPKWKCEEYEPWAKYCAAMCMGGTATLDVDTFRTESSQRRAGIWPTETNHLVSYMGVNEVEDFDQCMAPPDYGFRILTEQFVLSADKLSDEEWKARERQHAEEVIALTNKYAPNVTWDIVNGYLPVMPHYTANLARDFAPTGSWAHVDHQSSQVGKFRPVPELAGNRVPGIEGLYCTGTGWHPYAGAFSCQGYNAYKVMAEDLGLKKTWEGRMF